MRAHAALDAERFGTRGEDSFLPDTGPKPDDTFGRRTKLARFNTSAVFPLDTMQRKERLHGNTR